MLTTLFNFETLIEQDHLYFEKDYTNEFGILKDLTTEQWLTRILQFIPYWINTVQKNDGSDRNCVKLLYSILNHQQRIDGGYETSNTGMLYLYDSLKELIRDSYFSTAISDGLYDFGLDYTKIYPEENEHDWHFRWRIYEMLYEMKPTRSSLERSVLKYLGTSTVTRTGSQGTLNETRYQYTLPETYFYIVNNLYYKYIDIYKNNSPLIRDYHYKEIGKVGRKSRIIHFLEEPNPTDEITFIIKNFKPHKKVEITGSEVSELNLYRYILHDNYNYKNCEDINVNLRVYDNDSMLRRFEHFEEVGNEGETSKYVDLYYQSNPTDELQFDILGHSASDGYHMVTSEHHILEQKDYGFFGGSSYICISDTDLSFGDLVNVDEDELVCTLADASSGVEANGIVSEKLRINEDYKYVIKTKGTIKNRDRNSDRSFVWDFTEGATLYLGDNGTITETAPTAPDLVQEIGTASKSNVVQLKDDLNDNTEVNTFLNSPTSKFNRPGLLYVVVKNSVDHGAGFYNYNPNTCFTNVKDSFYGGSETNATQPGLAFYGIGPKVLLSGITPKSTLDKLMKEVDFCKTIGVHTLFELHPEDELVYKANRNI